MRRFLAHRIRQCNPYSVSIDRPHCAFIPSTVWYTGNALPLWFNATCRVLCRIGVFASIGAYWLVRGMFRWRSVGPSCKNGFANSFQLLHLASSASCSHRSQRSTYPTGKSFSFAADMEYFHSIHSGQVSFLVLWVETGREKLHELCCYPFVWKHMSFFPRTSALISM